MNEERIKTKEQMGILKPAHQVFEAIVDPDRMNKYFICCLYYNHNRSLKIYNC